MNDVKRYIMDSIRKLNREETELAIKVKQEFREKNKDLINSLRQKCEDEIGHSWKHTGYNITQDVQFFVCTICLKHKSVDLD